MSKDSDRGGYSYSLNRIKALRRDWREYKKHTLDEDEIYEHDSCWLNQREVEDALALIQEQVVEPDIFNSPEWLAELRERYKDLSNTPTILSSLVAEQDERGFYPDPVPVETEMFRGPIPSAGLEELLRLEALWERLGYDDTRDGAPDFRDLVTEHRAWSASGAVGTFVDVVLAGEYPTPEIMLAVAKSFRLYLLAAGSLTLESVFFGTPRRGGGSFAKRQRREQQLGEFHKTVLWERASDAFAKDKPASLEKIAAFFIEQEAIDNEIEYEEMKDVDSFLREYRRWKESR